MSKNNEEYDQKRKPKKFFDFRVWKQTVNLQNENIIGKTIKNQNDIKEYAEILNEEENNDKKKKIKKSSNSNLNKNLEKNTLLSDTAYRIVNDVDKIIKNMNDSTEELKKLNALYLIGTSKKINKSNLRSQTLPSVNNKISQELKDEIAINENNKKNPVNFKYINENYRKQLNRAFLNFNPIIHLGNLNILRKADPAINEDIEKLSKHIDEDLAAINSPNYYRKQYEKFINEKNEKLKKKNNPTNSTEGSTNINNSFSNSHLFIRRRNKKKIEIKRKFPDKDLRIKELEDMDNVLNKISLAVSEDNIKKYYDDYKILRNYNFEEQKHNYFDGMRKAINILKDIQQDKLIRGLNQETKSKRRYVDHENERIVDQILHSKDVLLKEIDEQEKK